MGSRARIPRSGFTEAVTTVVNETPTGAAGGALYAALTAYLGLDQFALENSSRSTTPVSRVAPATSGPLVTQFEDAGIGMRLPLRGNNVEQL